jgi:hypothetical protein
VFCCLDAGRLEICWWAACFGSTFRGCCPCVNAASLKSEAEGVGVNNGNWQFGEIWRNLLPLCRVLPGFCRAKAVFCVASHSIPVGCAPFGTGRRWIHHQQSAGNCLIFLISIAKVRTFEWKISAEPWWLAQFTHFWQDNVSIWSFSYLFESIRTCTKTGLQGTLGQCQDSRTHNTLRSVLAATPKEEFEAWSLTAINFDDHLQIKYLQSCEHGRNMSTCFMK